MHANVTQVCNARRTKARRHARARATARACSLRLDSYVSVSIRARTRGALSCDVMEEQCVPVKVRSSANYPNSWCELDCLCCPKPGTALGKQQEAAGIGLFHGRAVATDSADAAAEAAADALSKLEVDRAMGSYGSFDSSSGLVVATAGRSAPAMAALLAATGRGTLRKIIVASCSAGTKMAQALSYGIQEQMQQKAMPGDGTAQHIMSHAGGSTEEHAAWSAVVGSRSAGGALDCSATGSGGADTEGTVEDGQDWAALQAHLQADGIEPAGVDEVAAPELPKPAEVCVEDAPEVLARVHAGQVHVVLVGADSVDPVTGDAAISSDCAEARELALAAMRGKSGSGRCTGAKVVVVCASWSETPTGTTVLEPEAQGLLVGLPQRPAIS